MRVFDCFLFYNEFTLLELRLQELWNSVDYFVIGESNITFQNNPKSFYLKDNWHRFEKYASKIRHVMIEGFQRASLQRGLYDVEPNDIVCISDCDEIPRPSSLNYIKQDKEDWDRYILTIPLFYFKFNYMMIEPVHKQINIKVTKGRVLQNPHWERSSFDYIPGIKKLEHGGWHFTYLGNDNFAKIKIKSFSHSETNVPEIVDRIDVEKMVEQKVGLGWQESNEKFEYVQLDDYFPASLIQNKERYKSFIVDKAQYQVYDFYPR